MVVALALILVVGAPAGADPLGAVLEHRAAMLEAGERSAGCGVPAPAAAPETLEVAGRERRLIVALPEPYHPDVPHALVIAFHGRTSPAARVRRYYGLERHTTRPTVFVYPSGLPAARDRLTWSEAGDPPDDLRDFDLFDAIVRNMSELYCIDRERVFAVGHSLGAWFANSLACARGAGLRGVATVAGSISGDTCREPVAALLFHNPLDRLVPFEHGLRARDVLMDGRSGPPRLAEHAGFACLAYGAPPAEPLLRCPYSDSRTASGRRYPHRWPEHAGRAIMQFFDRLGGG